MEIKEAKFEIGKSYFCRSACDYDCIWTFKVVERTAKTIKLVNTMSSKGEITACRVFFLHNSQIEAVRPLGSYSMAPILSADKTITEE